MGGEGNSELVVKPGRFGILIYQGVVTRECYLADEDADLAAQVSNLRTALAMFVEIRYF